MSDRLLYEQVITNEYLGETKVIRGRDPVDLQARIDTQLNKWAEKEARLREREQAQRERSSAEAKAEELTREAQGNLADLERLLVSALDADHRVAWASLKDEREPPAFRFSRPQPTPPPDLELPSLADFYASMGVPPKRGGLLESIFPGIRRNRKEKRRAAKEAWQRATAATKHQHEQAVAAYRAQKQQWEADYAAAQEAHRTESLAFEERKRAQHASIDDLRTRFEHGELDAVRFYVSTAIEHSTLPCGFVRDYDVDYDPYSQTVVVSHTLPTIDDLPLEIEYRYVVSRKEIQAKEMKEKDRQALFGSVVDQLVLRTMHEVFQSCQDVPFVQRVVFNGWADGVDRKTGNPFHSCIISCQMSREQYEEINLAQVDPHECLRSLAALSAGPLHELAPVRPILQLDRADDRFVESRDVLAAIEAEGQNLATMEWEDFEHLVRELFERVFAADGCEVKITRASRDRGVDAIAFDPDPIRGGKFVIQAKRYNNVVGVDAVRDLYGTVINEGAARGILVTTAHYGRDAHEFAADKPLTLIDGPNLVHMLKEHGYNVHIEITKPSNSIK